MTVTHVRADSALSDFCTASPRCEAVLANTTAGKECGGHVPGQLHQVTFTISAALTTNEQLKALEGRLLAINPCCTWTRSIDSVGPHN